MLRKVIFVCLIYIGFTAGNAYAKEIKIGVVDMARIMKTAPQAVKAEKKLKNEFSPRQEKLEKMQKRLMGLEEDLKKSGSVMSESQRRQKEREILTGRRDLQRAEEEFREDANIRRNEEVIKLRKQINIALKKVAKKGGYDIILLEGVIFYSQKVDITDQVLVSLKQGSTK